MFAVTITLVVIMATVCNAELLTLSASDKQALVDEHNRLRSLTALGKTGSQPPATNMLALEWDDRLERSAANWAEKCTVGHDSDSDRAIPGYSWVGQNYASGGYAKYIRYVKDWYNEHKDFTYSDQSCSGQACGHYTQLVWAKTAFVGCAVAKCNDENFPYALICNYAPGGNDMSGPPYESGPTGSKCSGDYSNVQRGLCMRATPKSDPVLDDGDVECE